MNKFVNKYVVLGCVSSCLLSVAHANNAVVEFQEPLPDFRNIACTIFEEGYPRQETYTLINRDPSDIDLDISLVTPATDDSDVAVIIDTMNSTCIGNLNPPVNNIYLGQISGNNTCTIVLDIIQPQCESGPMSAPVDRELRVEVDTIQKDLVDHIHFDVTTLGAGENFALIGGGLASQGDGPVQIIGDIAADESVGEFDVTDGEFYALTDLIALTADADLAATYFLFQQQWDNNGCSTHDNIVDGEVITPGYYCLANTAGTDVLVDGTIELDGDGNYVFFINPECSADDSCFGLQFKPLTRFIYTNGASPDKIFWVMGNDAFSGDVLLQPNAVIDGSILMMNNDDSIVHTVAGEIPATVNGRLYLPNNAAFFLGNTIATH